MRRTLLRSAPSWLVAALALAPAVPVAPVTALHAQQSTRDPAREPGQPTDYFLPGASFDPAIPSPEAFLGYPIGAFHTRHDRIVAYMQELARLSDRASYQEIGRTWEHRPMPVLTVTAPAHQARLEEIRAAHIASTDPDTEAPAGSAELPVVVHLGYGVHGNETSSAEAAMLTAYWLVASTDAEVADYLQNGVWHVEPVLNPDGRDRHTHWANMHRAEPLVADPADREHNEVWPGGRTNHYWFDMNRDWLPLVHPESEARIDFHHAWRPQVVTDYHEMGTSSTYFFEPSEPVGSWNPLLPEELYTDITLRFADDWAAALDSLGALYFTKEVYDNSYPGYGSTYPNFLGGLGLVFEQASSRGHIQESSHHGVLTFPFAIRNHVRTSVATVRAAVEERQVLRDYQRRFFETALEEAEEDPVDGWIFGDPMDAALNRAFLDLLLDHRIEVHAVSEAREAGGVRFEPGSAWVVPARQPHYRLARSIFERTDEFLDSVFYDASTWTVSLAYGVPDAELRDGRLPLGERVRSVPEPVLAPVPRSGVAYVLDWRDSGAPRALTLLQDAGLRGEVAFEPFTVRTPSGEEASFGRGAVSLPLSIQSVSPDSVLAVVRAVQATTGAPIRAVASGFAVRGIDLGSRSFRPVREPRVLMPIGDGVSSYEAGQLWHLLDQRVGLPVSKVDVDDVGRVDLDRYNTIVLVSGGQSAFRGDALEELERWVRSGGTLVAIRGAAAWAAESGLTPAVAAPGYGAPVAEEEADAETEPARRDWADADEVEGAQAIGGSIWEADLDLTHPLAFGYQRRFLPVWRDHAFFFEPSESAYATVAQLTDDPHLSGYVSDENEARLAGSPSVLADELGQGNVVLLVDNPNFRGYWRGTNRLFLNALFFGDHADVP